jgi:hypothetical protein
MSVLERLRNAFRKGGRKDDLQANMQKALHMKQESGAQADIPPHRTAHEGMRPAPDPQASGGATRGSEDGFTPQFKRSHVARSGDT